MTNISEKSMVKRVVNIAQDFGYKATIESDGPPFRVFGWFPGRRFSPDITVKRDGQAVAVVIMRHPALLYDVHLTSQTQGKKDTGTILCVPDAEFFRIPGSVREYADELNVHLCPLSEVGETLKSMLE